MPVKEQERKIVELWRAFEQDGRGGIRRILRERDEEYLRRALEKGSKPDESETAES